jgi:uncharacterized protein
MMIPSNALLGGILIGVAALLLAAGSGRIAGISGIARGAILGPDRNWRWLFLAALIAGGWLMAGLHGAPAPSDAGAGTLLLAGLLVGIGTTLGNGCTSGHGVCGVARGSPRSLAATALFMATGMLTATLLGGALWP